MSVNNPDSYPQQEVKTGKQSEITPKIQKLAESFRGEEGELFRNIGKYVGDLKFDEKKKLDFRRTAEEIIDSKEHWGCHEQGLVAATLLRARGYPTTYITAFLRSDLESYDGENNLYKWGHVFLRVTMPDGRKELIRLNGEIIDKLPDEYVFGAEGLDADDIGLKTPDDYLDLFLEVKKNMTPNYPKLTPEGIAMEVRWNVGADASEPSKILWNAMKYEDTEDITEKIKAKHILMIMKSNLENIEKSAQKQTDPEFKEQQLKLAGLYRRFIDQGEEGVANYCERCANISTAVSEKDYVSEADRKAFNKASLSWQKLADKFHDSKVEVPRVFS